MLGTSYLDLLAERGDKFSRGRKGGAGPAGGRYFLINNPGVPRTGYSLVNVPFTPEVTRHSDLVLARLESKAGVPTETAPRREVVVIQKAGRDYARLQPVPLPAIHETVLTDDPDEIPFRQVAVIHGVDCLATTLNQECRYWAEGKRCRFCGIELSWKAGTVQKEKDPALLARAITEANACGQCTHVTITSGTGATPDKGLRDYVEALRELRARGVTVPLHVQYEPLADPALEETLVQELKAAGCASVGIHLEIWDEALRRQVCPGKSQVPRARYLESWRLAVDTFGHNQVHTYLLLGVGEALPSLEAGITGSCQAGVIPFLVPVRDIPGTNFHPVGLARDWKAYLALYQFAGRTLHQTRLDPFQSKAGCVRCGACSAIPEAFLETTPG